VDILLQEEVPVLDFVEYVTFLHRLAMNNPDIEYGVIPDRWTKDLHADEWIYGIGKDFLCPDMLIQGHIMSPAKQYHVHWYAKRHEISDQFSEMLGMDAKFSLIKYPWTYSRDCQKFDLVGVRLAWEDTATTVDAVPSTFLQTFDRPVEADYEFVN
jgi:hypothetical protein